MPDGMYGGGGGRENLPGSMAVRFGLGVFFLWAIDVKNRNPRKKCLKFFRHFAHGKAHKNSLSGLYGLHSICFFFLNAEPFFFLKFCPPAAEKIAKKTFSVLTIVGRAIGMVR